MSVFIAVSRRSILSDNLIRFRLWLHSYPYMQCDVSDSADLLVQSFAPHLPVIHSKIRKLLEDVTMEIRQKTILSTEK